MALILARGRRRDRFGQCLLSIDDLAAGTAQRLVQSIAAALRHQLAGSRPAGEADAMLATAGQELLARLEPGRGVDALTATLVDLLHAKGALGDELLLAVANEGEISFVAEAFGRLGRIPAQSVLEELLSADARRIMALLRVAGASRELSAGLLAAIGDLLGIGDPGEAIGIFDRMTEDHVSVARAWLSTAPTYRSALEALGEGHGQRPL
jgi:hypothetical protein